MFMLLLVVILYMLIKLIFLYQKPAFRVSLWKKGKGMEKINSFMNITLTNIAILFFKVSTLITHHEKCETKCVNIFIYIYI